jgi:Zn-dependent peptidase ImmA (M78 family)
MRVAPNYSALHLLAQQKRADHKVVTSALNLNVVRRIYRDEGIRIDQWKFPASIRAVYMCDDGDPSVAVNNGLPREPKLFSLIHELKHHYLDQQKITNGEIRCGDYNSNQAIEVAAEVFAAEFIYPEQEFLQCVTDLGISLGLCAPEDVVQLKRECTALVSYTFLRKRLVRMGFGSSHVLDGVQYQKLEERMFGTPIYKQPWFKNRRPVRKS